MVRVLTINDGTRAEIARVLTHAHANHYHPGPGAKPPGDDERFVAKLDSYRAVFSLTHADGIVYRHLSISVPGKSYPHPFAVFTIASLFCFTGRDERTVEPPPDGWLIDLNQRDHCIVLAQPMAMDRREVAN
jgi:hypothetical protein